MTFHDTISENIDGVQRRILAACQRAGRSPSEVQLVAVTKYAEVEWVQTLINLDHRDFGESRPQQLSERSTKLSDNIRWHMIGHLQRNKVRPVLETGAMIHSVDSQRLLDRIELIAAELGITVSIFMEVNISGEESKYGFAPESVSQSVTRMSDYRHVKLLGLMTMAPHADDPEDARPYFRALRDLQQQMNQGLPAENQMQSLSMGMSGDFEVAIEEGATHIRIGSALFEGLSSD